MKLSFNYIVLALNFTKYSQSRPIEQNCDPTIVLKIQLSFALWIFLKINFKNKMSYMIRFEPYT